MYSPTSWGLVIMIRKRRTAPSTSLTTLSLKSTGWPSFSHLPSALALATSHSSWAVWDSATVMSCRGLMMAPPSGGENKHLHFRIRKELLPKKYLVNEVRTYQRLRAMHWRSFHQRGRCTGPHYPSWCLRW